MPSPPNLALGLVAATLAQYFSLIQPVCRRRRITADPDGEEKQAARDAPGGMMSVDSTLRKAAKLAKAGNRAGAAALYREVLAKFPGNATAKRGLAALTAPTAPAAPARSGAMPGGALGAGLIPQARPVAPPAGAAPRQQAKAKPGRKASRAAKTGAPRSHGSKSHGSKSRPPSGPAPSPQQMQALERLMQRRDYRSVVAEGQRLALLFPRAPGLLTLLAQTYGRMGETDKALATYDKVIEADPGFAGAYSNKASLYALTGQYEAALTEARAALKLDPTLAQAHMLLGYALVNTGRPGEALAPFREAVKRAPELIQSHLGLGNTYAALFEPEKALVAFEAARALEPDNAEVLNNVANALVALNRYDEGVAVFERAEQRDSNNTVLFINHARALRELGRAREAEKMCRRALAINENLADAWSVLASVLREIGDKTGAAQAVDRAREIDPSNLQALAMRWNMSPLPLDHPDYARVLTLSQDDSVEPRERTTLGYALYRAHDNANDPAGAMPFLLAANRVRTEYDPYDMDANEAILVRLMDTFRAGVPALAQADLDEIPAPARPVFIVGMPRSGTSLVEQILASHSDVHGAGELRALGELLHGFGWDVGKTPRPFDRDTLRALRRGYFEHLVQIGATDKPVVTDKTPLNFRHVGPALAAMPEARVLFMRRDARATCWSNFSNTFMGRANNFGNNMEHTARMYRLHLQFLDLWTDLYPDRVTMVPYERLTEDQEAESRKLVAAAGLEWQDACLDFHKTKRAVRTVSSEQVKRKMYTGSSQAWRRYEPYLGEMIEALGGIDADR